MTPSGSGRLRLPRTSRNRSAKQPVGVGRGGAGLHQVDDEPQPFQLVARVDTLRALAPRRDHDAVAFLPGPQCRRLDPEHAGHRPDRIDRPTAQTRPPPDPTVTEPSSPLARPTSRRDRSARAAGSHTETGSRSTASHLEPDRRPAAATNSRSPDASMNVSPAQSSSTSPSPDEPGPDLAHAGDVELTEQPHAVRAFELHDQRGGSIPRGLSR